ncbi:MAG: threonine ammonia-lyase [Campylobacterota bacterium]|nr:threonine ammonia-lyase [Campylobacterota bacterium]
MINIDNINKAKKRLNGIIRPTPMAFAPILSKNLNANIYLKKENLQLTGSFKLRGAYNKIATLSEDERSKGVVAASAGNHAQGVAYSAQHFNCDATIIMPEATPLTKVSGVASYDAEVILHGANYDEAYRYALNYTEKYNKSFVHPFADDDVINGQGTIALEIFEEIDDIDIIVVPIGGGGLISGIATAAKHLKPNIKIIGVVASGAKAMKNSFELKTPIDSVSVRTIADGIAVRDTTPKMLDYVLDLVDEIVEVEDKEIASAILFLLEQHKLVVEGAGAVGTAALMHNKISNLDGKTIVLPLSGGNIDVTMLAQIIEKGLVKSARKMNLIVTLIDKPGSLKNLTNTFENLNANIVQIDYDRNSLSLDFGDANVTISLETKGFEHQTSIRNELKNSGFRFKEL